MTYLTAATALGRTIPTVLVSLPPNPPPGTKKKEL